VIGADTVDRLPADRKVCADFGVLWSGWGRGGRVAAWGFAHPRRRARPVPHLRTR